MKTKPGIDLFVSLVGHYTVALMSLLHTIKCLYLER